MTFRHNFLYIFLHNSPCPPYVSFFLFCLMLCSFPQSVQNTDCPLCAYIITEIAAEANRNCTVPGTHQRRDILLPQTLHDRCTGMMIAVVSSGRHQRQLRLQFMQKGKGAGGITAMMTDLQYINRKVIAPSADLSAYR